MGDEYVEYISEIYKLGVVGFVIEISLGVRGGLWDVDVLSGFFVNVKVIVKFVFGSI